MTARITFWDIETQPIVAHVWGLRDQNIGLNQIVQRPEIMGFAYKTGKCPVKWVARWDDCGYQGMLDKARQVMDASDAVVSYNGAGFDTKWLNGELVKAGLTPPAPFKHIDLYRVVRANFRLPSYKLQYVCQHLDIGSKMDTGGHDLWTGCMNGDKKARAKMGRYCRQDVALLPAVLERLRPWLPPSINMALLSGVESLACQKCGSVNLESRGTAYTATRAYPQYQCRDCGGWTRDTRSVGSTKSAGIPR